MNHWSNYWSSSKTLNSFAESDVSSGYTGEIKQYWFDIFSTLKSNSRIVDIGCGNGALACLAVEYSNLNNLNFEVHGIDAADIKPLDSLKHDKKLSKLLSEITFHPNTPAESLPFKPNSIDLFISQFGFEYADIPKAISECHKALASNGSIHIMAHHPESIISADTKAGLYVLDKVLHKSPLFLQVDLLLDIATQVYNSGQYKSWHSNPYNLTISRTIKWIIGAIKKELEDPIYATWVQDIFNRIIPILQKVSSSNPQHLRQHLAEQFTALEQHRIRLDEQDKATFTEERLNILKEKSLDLNFTTQSNPFTVQQKLFAWSIQIR